MKITKINILFTILINLTLLSVAWGLSSFNGEIFYYNAFYLYFGALTVNWLTD